MRAPTPNGQAVSLRGVAWWIVQARGTHPAATVKTTFAHDLTQERAARWIASAPLAGRSAR